MLLAFNFLMVMLSIITDFKTDQKKNPRVAIAYHEKESMMRSVLLKNRIEIGKMEIFIRIFKKEKVVELWARNKREKFIRIEYYPICESSGTLGPKRQQGDGQVPEGFYTITTFNPASNFYLSLRINYPNKSDRILGNSVNPGGDIFIHGNCVTIGCIPITDDKIKELYIYAVEARNNGQENIPVHIFPASLSDEDYRIIRDEYKSRPDLLRFWENLKEGFDYFEEKNDLPSITVDATGYYQFH